MYSGLQKGMSIESIITFDTLEKILNFYFNPYTINIRYKQTQYNQKSGIDRSFDGPVLSYGLTC